LAAKFVRSVRHADLAISGGRDGHVLVRRLTRTRAPVQLAQTEVALSDERAHRARLGERQRLAVVGLAS
jgi:6-phosphogluconolactonase/glucosamine-6-phosphate isomerase/deaminase